MILPITAYGDPVLRKKAAPISQDYPGLAELIANMFETMDKADGVGLAAPQVGLGIRLFVVDTAPLAERKADKDAAPIPGLEKPELLKDFHKVFINAEVLERYNAPWPFEEGCLSIPGIREDVERPATITIQYKDEQFREHTETFTGLRARVIQHEYDHIEGILFTDYCKPFRKQLLRGKLTKISKGQTDADYPMTYYKPRKLKIA